MSEQYEQTAATGIGSPEPGGITMPGQTQPSIAPTGIGPSEPASGGPDTATATAGQVTKTATEQVQQVAQETGSQVRSLVDTATHELRDQAGTQQQRIAGGLHTIADDLSSMCQGNGSDRMAGQLMQQVSAGAHRTADWLEHREPGKVLDEVRDYARRHPGTFLLGALAAGLVVGRLTRNIASAPRGANEAALPPAAPMQSRLPMERAGDRPARVTPDELAYTGAGGRYEQESEVSR
ncbi:hypothetical protein ACFQZ4_50870 [Catellatospora coxensis]|uniref:DUF3618 domain-containing protein n=1 Tax=Catellatospora coxensis TaxID=310354 RepID=A0A8J3P631_9ACTN|nr:hypothetical protein [Catellatospora coxensis]GIG05042.1 hypothetical protein Cco03nite_17420 [Catellatospora coxensis]